MIIWKQLEVPTYWSTKFLLKYKILHKYCKNVDFYLNLLWKYYEILLYVKTLMKYTNIA